MKRFLITMTLLGASLIGAAVLSSVAGAEEESISPAQIERIKSNCVDAKSNLNQIHASDGLLRVNRGQLYESISTKLMAPLNSRMVLNRIDTKDFLSLATKYDRHLSEFRTEYQ